jgi:glycosyltransferase involved in cell wall biosynthesis
VVAASAAALDELGAVIDALGAEGFVVTAMVGSMAGATRIDASELDLLVRDGALARAACFSVLVARFAEMKPSVVVSCIDDRHGIVASAARVAGCDVVVALIESWGRSALHRAIESLAERLPARAAALALRGVRPALPSRLIALSRGTAERIAANVLLEPRLIRLDAGLGVSVDDVPDLAARAEIRREARRRLGLRDGRRTVAVVGSPARRSAAIAVLARVDASVEALQCDTAVESLRDATVAVVASDVVWVVSDDGAPRVLMAAAVAGAATVACDAPTFRACVRDGETGVLAATDALGAAQVVSLLDRADERLSLGMRAQRYAARIFDRDLAARRVIEVVRAAAGGEPLAPATLGPDGAITARRPGARDLLG